MNSSTLPTRTRRHRAPHRVATLLTVGVALVALTSCSAADVAPAPSGPAAASGTPAPLELTDGWAKAADADMTAVFGTLENTGEHTVTVSGVTTDGVAGTTQLHETVMDPETGSMQMQEKEGGFSIDPRQSLTLEPGGDHIMLMDLRCSLKAGTELGLELELEDGVSEHLNVPVRDYQGAQEHYAPGDETGGHAGHSGTADSDHAAHGGSPAPSALPECHAH